MKVRRVCVLGGTGFVGHHVVHYLANVRRFDNLRLEIRVPTRNRERHRDLLVVPTLSLINADVHDPVELENLFQGCDAVINLVGILNEKGSDGGGFRKVHVDLPRKVVDACRKAGVHRLLHMSALGADAAQGQSRYQRTKGEGERLVLDAESEELHVTVFRPSVIFGANDGLYNRFAQLLRLSPFVFPLACPDAKLSPVFVGDVAEAFHRTLGDRDAFGQAYDLCGPRAYTLREVVAYTARVYGLRRRVWGLGEGTSRWQARMLERLPGKPFSMDNYQSLQAPSVCTVNGLETLGIQPTEVEGVVPYYVNPKQTPAGAYAPLGMQDETRDSAEYRRGLDRR